MIGADLYVPILGTVIKIIAQILIQKIIGEW